MLVLTRRLGEEIVIDGCIRIRVMATTGGVARLGITAPPTVVVDRAEVHLRRRAFAAAPPPESAPVSHTRCAEVAASDGEWADAPEK